MAAQYDDFAEKYQRIMTSPILMRAKRILDYTFMRLVGDISGKSVLDLACGAGDYPRKLKQAGASHTVGVDISEEMINIINNRLTTLEQQLLVLQEENKTLKSQLDSSNKEIVVTDDV